MAKNGNRAIRRPPTCSRCRFHGMPDIRVRSHTCPLKHCTCEKCILISERTEIYRNHQAMLKAADRVDSSQRLGQPMPASLGQDGSRSMTSPSIPMTVQSTNHQQTNDLYSCSSHEERSLGYWNQPSETLSVGVVNHSFLESPCLPSFSDTYQHNHGRSNQTSPLKHQFYHQFYHSYYREEADNLQSPSTPATFAGHPIRLTTPHDNYTNGCQYQSVPPLMPISFADPLSPPLTDPDGSMNLLMSASQNHGSNDDVSYSCIDHNHFPVAQVPSTNVSSTSIPTSTKNIHAYEEPVMTGSSYWPSTTDYTEPTAGDVTITTSGSVYKAIPSINNENEGEKGEEYLEGTIDEDGSHYATFGEVEVVFPKIDGKESHQSSCLNDGTNIYVNEREGYVAESLVTETTSTGPSRNDPFEFTDEEEEEESLSNSKPKRMRMD